MTHSHTLPLICDDLPVQFQLYKHFNKFMFGISRSNDSLVKLCCQLSECGSMANVIQNLKTVKH